MNENFNLFKDLLNGIDKDIDLADMVLNESTIKNTNAVDGMNLSSPTCITSHDSAASDSGLTMEDFNALNDIMSEIVEMKNSSDRDLALEANPASSNYKQARSLSRLDSISAALGDYNLTDFDLLETSIQMNDPMLGVDVLSKTLNIF